MAELAVRCGLTLAQACEHTLPQLNLLAAAAARLQAREASMHLETTLAALGFFKAKNGPANLKQLQKALRKQGE